MREFIRQNRERNTWRKAKENMLMGAQYFTEHQSNNQIFLKFMLKSKFF